MEGLVPHQVFGCLDIMGYVYFESFGAMWRSGIVYWLSCLLNNINAASCFCDFAVFI